MSRAAVNFAARLFLQRRINRRVKYYLQRIVAGEDHHKVTRDYLSDRSAPNSDWWWAVYYMAISDERWINFVRVKGRSKLTPLQLDALILLGAPRSVCPRMRSALCTR